MLHTSFYEKYKSKVEIIFNKKYKILYFLLININAKIINNFRKKGFINFIQILKEALISKEKVLTKTHCSLIQVFFVKVLKQIEYLIFCKLVNF